MCVFMHGSGSGYAKCGLVPLAKGGATVWTPSLTQGKAEQEPQGEEEDGAEDPQACEVVLQDANPDTQHNKLIRKKCCILFLLSSAPAGSAPVFTRATIKSFTGCSLLLLTWHQEPSGTNSLVWVKTSFQMSIKFTFLHSRNNFLHLCLPYRKSQCLCR